MIDQEFIEQKCKYHIRVRYGFIIVYLFAMIGSMYSILSQSTEKLTDFLILGSFTIISGSILYWFMNKQIKRIKNKEYTVLCGVFRYKHFSAFLSKDFYVYKNERKIDLRGGKQFAKYDKKHVMLFYDDKTNIILGVKPIMKEMKDSC